MFHDSDTIYLTNRFIKTEIKVNAFIEYLGYYKSIFLNFNKAV